MRKTVITCLVLLFAAGVVVAVETEDTNTYLDILGDYEAIRLVLLEDSLTGVADHAASIEQSVTSLLGDFQAERAGVAEDKSEESLKLLPEIAAAAEMVATATDLEAVRAGFFELSKPFGRYRKLVGDLDSKVVFCPMAKKAWIQPEGEVGNPYLGSEMPTCGRIIAD